jgi:ketopantoate reductase
VNIAVVGAGALGSVYGVRLAVRGNVDVTFVVRPARVTETSAIAIQAIRSGKRDAIERPVRVAHVPPDADVILLTVGTEDVDGLTGLLHASEAPIVILTPMMPQDFARMRAAFGKRALAAMPNVIAYAREGVVRYWLAPAPTRIDESRAEPVRELAEALSRAGLRGRLELGVHETNPATTVCYIAIGMALAVAGSAEALAADDTLLSITTRACREGVRLSHRIGRAEPWAGFAPVLSAPWAMRAWLGALRRVSPEALFYAEEHFARKLEAQHRSMLGQMIELADEKQLPAEALRALAERLRSSA